MDHILHKIQTPGKLKVLYASNLLFALHGFLILYINSSYVEMFLSAETVGYLFIVGSLINLVLLINASTILKRVGSTQMALLLFILEFIAVLGLGLSTTPPAALFFFVLYLSTWPLIIYTFDIFLESIQKNEAETGGTRGLYLTLQNAALVISPALAGLIIGENNFTRLYTISALILIPLFLLFRKTFRQTTEPKHRRFKLGETLGQITQSKTVFNIMAAQMVLRVFYAWMTIYMPIYLHDVIGFSWPEIGLIFTIMLLPFVLFELPAGYLADRKYGEKEILIFGFIILSISTVALSFFSAPVLLLWAALLFLTRTGASLVDIMTETHFFKHVSGNDSNIISFFRIAQPLGFLIAPIIASITLGVIDLKYSFIIIGLFVLIGIFFGARITDSR